MTVIKIDSPLMSRNILEIFDIIESLSDELNAQRDAIGRLYDMLEHADMVPRGGGLCEILIHLKNSSDYCSRMLS